MKSRHRWLLAAIVAALIALVFLLVDRPGDLPTAEAELHGSAAPDEGKRELALLPPLQPTPPLPAREPEVEPTPVPEASPAAPPPVGPAPEPPLAPPSPNDPAGGFGSAAPLLEPVRFGSQVCIAATVSEVRAVVDGNAVDPDTLPVGLFQLSLERCVFVVEEPFHSAARGAADRLRTYSECRIACESDMHGSSFVAQGQQVGGVAGPSRRAFSSRLEGAQVRPGPAGSVLLVESAPRPQDAEPLELLGTRWDLGESAFLPDHPVWTGSTWRVAPSSFTALLVPGGDLQLQRTEDEPAAFALLLPFGVTAPAEWGELEGDIAATAKGSRWVEGRERASAWVVIDLRGESRFTKLARLLQVPDEVKLEGSATAKFDFEGVGDVEWTPGESTPPRSEVHCVFSAEVDVDVSVDAHEAHRVEISYRLEGQFAYLGGLPSRSASIWESMGLSREKFLAPESFVLQRP